MKEIVENMFRNEKLYGFVFSSFLDDLELDL